MSRQFLSSAERRALCREYLRYRRYDPNATGIASEDLFRLARERHPDLFWDITLTTVETFLFNELELEGK